jgi:hypothetical protein
MVDPKNKNTPRDEAFAALVERVAKVLFAQYSWGEGYPYEDSLPDFERLATKVLDELFLIGNGDCKAAYAALALLKSTGRSRFAQKM